MTPSIEPETPPSAGSIDSRPSLVPPRDICGQIFVKHQTGMYGDVPLYCCTLRAFHNPQETPHEGPQVTKLDQPQPDTPPPGNASVNHPPHYGGKTNPYEAIKVIEAWGAGFHLGNTLKYLARVLMGQRRSTRLDLEDLQKARWYLDRHIEVLAQAVKLFEEPS